MSGTAYQVFYTNENGERKYVKENFCNKEAAQDAVDDLVDQGYEDICYGRIILEPK